MCITIVDRIKPNTVASYLQNYSTNEGIHRGSKNRIGASVTPQHDATLSEYGEQVQHSVIFCPLTIGKE